MIGITGMVGCGDGPVPPPADPCGQTSFDQTLCQAAVAQHGYYWYGVWRPMSYLYPYSYYYGGYHTYIASGGIVRPAGSGVYSRSYTGSGSPSAGSGTVRGVGGTIGAARSAGSFGE